MNGYDQCVFAADALRPQQGLKRFFQRFMNQQTKHADPSAYGC